VRFRYISSLKKGKTMRNFLVVCMLTLGLGAEALNLPEHFKASFTQMVTNPKKKVLQYSGKIVFSKPSLIKWSYLQPTQKEVCSNKKVLTVVDHDLEQVSTYHIDKAFNLENILHKAKLHSKNIYVSHYKNKNYTIQIDSKKHLQSIAYFDDLDNKVQIVLKKVTYGKNTVGKNEVTCTIPKDYDRIRG